MKPTDKKLTTDDTDDTDEFKKVSGLEMSPRDPRVSGSSAFQKLTDQARGTRGSILDADLSWDEGRGILSEAPRGAFSLGG